MARRVMAFGVSLLGVAAAVVVAGALRQAPSSPVGAPPSLLGTEIPSVSVRTAAGDTVPLSSLIKGQPALIAIVGVNDCLSCAHYATELRIIRERIPGLATFLIGSGPGDSVFAAYFARERIKEMGLFDGERHVIAALPGFKEPLVLLLDAGGHILFADNRSSSEASQFPIGRLIPSLAASLTRPTAGALERRTASRWP